METGNFFPKYLETIEYNHLSNAVVRCIAVYFHVYKKRDWTFFMSWGMITYGVPPGHTGLSQGNINTSSVTHRLPVAFMNRDLASGKRTSWDRSQKPRYTQSWDPCKHWLDTASAIKRLIYISAASAAQGQPKIFLSGTAPCCVFSAVNVRIWWGREENTRGNKQSS